MLSFLIKVSAMLYVNQAAASYTAGHSSYSCNLRIAQLSRLCTSTSTNQLLPKSEILDRTLTVVDSYVEVGGLTLVLPPLHNQTQSCKRTP